MKITRITAVTAVAVLALSACGSGEDTSSSAKTGADGKFQALNRLEIIAPAAPGSGWDQAARGTQEALGSANLVKAAEVKNVPGASGTVALAQIAPQKGKKDLWITSGLAMMSGVISNGTDVTLDDLTPLARLMGEYEVIVTPADSPYKSVEELFTAIKKDPKSVAIAGGSAGSADHIYIGLLAQHFGVKPADVNYVPYSGGGEATTAILGGKVQAGVSGLSEFAAQIKDGKMKGLLVSSPKPVDGTPFAQTAADVDKSLEFQNWRSMMAPGGLDDSLKTRYIEALKKMHGSQGWKDIAAKNAWNDNFLAGDEFATWLKEENTRVTGVLGELGLSKN
ncbi:tripartite tricarboxylate transporter substrate binding protein [Streptomyces sp. SID4919]|uniref:Bug family tripartite tricarboxylate transporter substrate binding protein n=1 Tax=unclassified Streptomyces TaxID=2593676 RepID=UPI000823F4BD|nr:MULTISPECIES: tripartite tricarboxylate transporter substrate-binding protein [unclassified Streptomyces]MYY10724.1 tripartite tricarboxylate transporter substrate binding protein [Streptomyces sp. SID4919]SCK62376.1 putative tricarboxylic transport membrane protein [Streptomyces sp. AmelKG-E11A]